MKVQLMRRDWGSWLPNVPTDYTGRWKIKVVNGHKHLYLECFELEEVVTQEEYKYVAEIPTYKTCKFLWWSWEEFMFKQRVEEIIPKRTKIRAKVEWINERDLDIRVTEEFVNQCESCYDDAH